MACRESGVFTAQCRAILATANGMPVLQACRPCNQSYRPHAVAGASTFNGVSLPFCCTWIAGAQASAISSSCESE